MTHGKIGRRDFIKRAMVAGASLIVAGGLFHRRRSLAGVYGQDQAAIDRAMRDHKLGHIDGAETQTVVTGYISGSLGKPRVVHVHAPSATNWAFDDSYYGDCVDQDVVNEMVDRGVMELMGTSVVGDAWRALIPSYSPGEAVAIKVNLNNGEACGDSDIAIDALIHPVNAVVRGLQQIGVAEEDVWIYDAMRKIPDRFVNGCLYPHVQFFGGCRQSPGWSSDDPDAFVMFNPSSGAAPSPRRIPDLLVAATYLINIPIVKRHSLAGVTLGFKNHMGTIERPKGLHEHICPGGDHFRTWYSPLVDIYNNPHVGAKTVLTIGDGLFGGRKNESAAPSPWVTFGDGAPNSLLFATDPVALDSVAYDLLATETTIIDDSDAYLSAAAEAGLGVFEHGDPWGDGYSQIDYVRVDRQGQ
jgi:uncharacterized protein (DUF362 family)